MIYGNKVAKWRGDARSVIGDVDRSIAGNIILRVGRETALGWGQTEHVVLLPNEATQLVESIQEQLNTGK